MPASSDCARLVVVGAHGQLQVDTIADDVVFRAAMDGADRDDAGFEWVDRAAHERLQRHDDLRCDEHGIDAACGKAP